MNDTQNGTFFSPFLNNAADTVQLSGVEVSVLNSVVVYFDQKIAFYSSVDSIPEDVQQYPDKFMHKVAANRIVKDLLRTERDNIVKMIEAQQQT